MRKIEAMFDAIIPYQELSGSYNFNREDYANRENYTIPRTVRELQHQEATFTDNINYTIPRTVIKLHLHNSIRPILYTYQLFA